MLAQAPQLFSRMPCYPSSSSTARAPTVQLSGKQKAPTPDCASSVATTVTASAAVALGAVAGSRRLRRSKRRSRFDSNARLRRTAVGATRGADKTRKAVPVVLLSGFLGTGKTTLLKHWLENADGDKIGVVVNDVAAVNIDADLIKKEAGGSQANVQTIQLQNGCACCSMGDELLYSIYDLVQLASDENEPFQQIIVELSGVAEPRRVRELFDRAAADGTQESLGVELKTVVTVVDSSTFCSNYMEYKQVMERPDLMEEDAAAEMADYKVVELLVEQVEAADVVILNKLDLASKDDLDVTRATVAALNEDAELCETSFSKVPLGNVLGSFISDAHEAPHEVGHSHVHAEEQGHGHGHEEVHAHGHEACHDPECDHPSHGHAHSHSHSEACNDPDCTDASHAHPHGHSHENATMTTAESRFGITSFTYEARRPFQADRLASVLQSWPEPQKSLGEFLQETDVHSDMSDRISEGEMPFSRVLRSKGFCWLQTHPGKIMYWSHAGNHMLLSYEGVWWGAMTENQLKIVTGMNGDAEYKQALKEKWSDDFADRRQELVFIGQRMKEAEIRFLLDECLLTDEEMEDYKEAQEKDMEMARKTVDMPF
eukprot:TRINITY_DN16231_c0_g1_i2.p1 TRINITY_DN16231_c0_g1~~TRINITY_DN16231_c0_g1_i2.p1  ORF type:complete len:601 (+),score=113.49 TRINITY_DN16231_c0_g1_i2:91-1893(+)